MKRSPLVRRTPLRRVSLRRRRAERAAAKAYRQVCDRSGGWCEARVTDLCGRRAVHVHHRLPRSAGGRDTTTNLLHVCAQCHGTIHAHPREARSAGFLRPRWTAEPAVEDVSNPSLDARLAGHLPPFGPGDDW